LFSFKPNDNHSCLLLAIFKKNLEVNVFWLEYKNSVLGMGPPTPTQTGPKLGVSLLKKPPMHQFGALSK
jgi:hypothetical protein